MNNIWSQVIDEAVHAAKQAPRLYFAPFVGAVRETRRVFREIQLENESRGVLNRRAEAHDDRGN